MYTWFWILLVIVIIIAVGVLIWVLLRNEPTRRFGITLSGDQVVPPVSTSASGSGEASLSADRRVVDYDFQVNNLSTTATAARFHRGETGVNGPIVKNLNLQSLGNGSYRINGRWTSSDATQPLTANLVDDLLAGRIYASVATTQYPDGEVRGQLVPLLQ